MASREYALQVNPLTEGRTMEAKEYTTSGYETEGTIYHYGVMIEKGKPTTGVFTLNMLEWIHDDMMDGVDLGYETYLDELPDDEEPEYGGESGTTLIGFVETTADDDKAWYVIGDKAWKPDPSAEYSAICGEYYVQVIASVWRIRGALCSPCYPGQVDGDTNGEVLAYSIPPEVVGSDYDDSCIEGPKLKARIFKAE